MKILVTGADGQLGMELRKRSVTIDAEWEFTDIGELDISARNMVLRHLTRSRPDVVINAAAYTAVDQAESEPDLARQINELGAQYLSEGCRSVGSRLMHISTDFVFDGTTSRPYREEDLPNPINVYGTTKLAGEKAVLEHSARGVIVRTSWLYSAHGKNFVKTILKLASGRDELRAVEDQVGSPTWAGDLASALLIVVPRLNNTEPQIYHYCNAGAASWYDFAQAIVELAGRTCKILPIPGADYPTPAERPAQSRLDTQRIRRTFEIPVSHWRESLSMCIDEIQSGEMV
ncbi:MAG: dTDP-4-dehydrorhamnose reductase [bacterium]